MATKQATADFIVDQLSSLANIRTRKMFGEYALYYEDKVVALICDDELFVKITEAGRELMGEYYQEGLAYPGAKPSMLISGDLLEDRKWLAQLIMVTYENLPAAKMKIKKRPN